MAKVSDNNLEARKAVEFLQTSKLIDLKQPLDQVIAAVSKLDNAELTVIALTRLVLIIADCPKRTFAE